MKYLLVVWNSTYTSFSIFQFELKELKRRKEEDESRKRQEEIEKATPVRHPTDRSEGDRAESASIKSASKYD